MAAFLAGISYVVSNSSCYSYGEGYDAFDAYIDTDSTEISYSFAADGKGSVSLKEFSNLATTILLNANYTFTDSTKTPAREPADGSNIVSVYDLGLSIGGYWRDRTVDLMRVKHYAPLVLYRRSRLVSLFSCGIHISYNKYLARNLASIFSRNVFYAPQNSVRLSCFPY